MRLTVIFDCCHSGPFAPFPPSPHSTKLLISNHIGTGIELPFSYRTDSQGNLSLQEKMKKGAQLAMSARRMMQPGGFNIGEAKALFQGASSLWKSFGDKNQGGGGGQQDGLGQENFVEDWHNEGKDVWCAFYLCTFVRVQGPNGSFID